MLTFGQWLELVWPDIDEPKVTDAESGKRPDVRNGAGFPKTTAKLPKWKRIQSAPDSEEKNKGFNL